MNLIKKLQQLLDPYDASSTECDGMTKLCSTVLQQQGIEHQPMIGMLQRGETEISPHLWIDLPTGESIDYRARMWLGNEGVPHGVFMPHDFSDVIYSGTAIALEPLPPIVVELLLLPIDITRAE